MTTWLLLDCNYLCFRAFHSMRDLAFDGKATGVAFGFFSELLRLRESFQSPRFILCFDHGKNKRKAIYPKYKANRQEGKTEEELQEYREVQGQIEELKQNLLPELGFANIIYQDGYEADDMVAVASEHVTFNLKHSKAIIVTADEDFYQLLGNRVSLWNPNKKQIYTVNCFRDEWHIEPTQWADVKAIAGCSGDNVDGTEGVGEKTAAKFIRGQLNPKTKTYSKIVCNNDLWKRNLKLVRLPLAGVKKFSFKKDRVDRRAWRRVMSRLGMISIREDW